MVVVASYLPKIDSISSQSQKGRKDPATRSKVNKKVGNDRDHCYWLCTAMVIRSIDIESQEDVHSSFMLGRRQSAHREAVNFPSIEMILSTAFLYPGSTSNISMYSQSLGYFSFVKLVLPFPAINGKLNKTSAPVRFGPHRYFPPEVPICCSRKVKWVLKFGSKKLL